MELSALFSPKLIRASAGSGKTFELSNRFISLLAAGERPDRILATTFTRKAAGEIQERVFLRLAKAALDQKEAAELAEYVKQPQLSMARAAELLAGLIRRQHRLRICTLDSFFFQIALSFEFELGLTPGWSIADTAQNAQFYRDVVHAVCGGKDSASLAQLVRLLNRGTVRRSIHRQIEREVAALHELYRETDRRAWDWMRVPKGLEQQELAAAKQRLAEFQLPLTKKGTVNKRWEQPRARAVALVDEGDWQGFVKDGIAAKIICGEAGFAGVEIPAEAREAFKPLIAHAAAILLGRLRGQTKATYELLDLFHGEYQRRRLASRTLGFSDVKHMLVQASIMDKLGELYYRLDSQIAHLLFDEFQDTSSAEWQVLEPMADELLAKSSGEYSFFCVGDVKQAIYGWRGGVAEIFNTLESRWSHLNCESREMSFRLSRPVVDTVNRVFEHIAESPALTGCQPAAAEWGGRFQPHTTARPERAGYTALMVAEQLDDGQEEPADAVVRETALLVKGIVEQSPEISIGVLVRRNALVGRLIYELRKDPAGIRASEEGGNPLTDSPAVMLILSLLTFVDHPGDTISRFHVAASPLGEFLGFTEYHDTAGALRIADRIKRELELHGYGRAIWNYVNGITGACCERDRYRLMQLVGLAHAYDSSGTVRCCDFVELVKVQKVEDPSTSNVRVMTIHQSKGLEFDAVILPELDFRLLGGPVDPVMTYRSNPVAAPERICRSTSEMIRRLYPPLEEMSEQNRTERLKEALSVLYVAMTRAKHALYMLIEPGRESEKLPLSYAGILRAALGNAAALPGTIEFETGDRNWAAEVAGTGKQQAEDQQEPGEIGELKLAKAPRQRSRGLLRRTPSDLEGGTDVDLRYRMQLGSAKAMNRGSVIHRLFETVEWLDDGAPEFDELRAAAAEIGARGEEADNMIAEFHSVLKAQAVSDVLMQTAYNETGADTVEVYREQPFAFREGDALLVGTFDRIVIGRQADQVVFAEVLDYKTDRVSTSDPADLNEKVEFYKPQMEAYRSALARFAGIERSRVSARLVFLTAGCVCTI